jgi:methylated-DNA-protein-cysteine methyltransferase-like protein
MQKGAFFQQVYGLVKKIPAGKVMTYGEVAKALNENWNLKNDNSRINARTVGWALHANTSPEVPCHRVVDKEGRLAANFAFDGEAEQRRRLMAEGVTFNSQGLVNLEKHVLDTLH